MASLKLFILLFIVFTPLAWSSQCGHLIGNCDYYQCVQREKSCYQGGYMINYGLPYCQTFQKLEEENISSYLNDWISEARNCLMLEMENFWEDKSCLAIRLKAFDSHVMCYKKTGFCQMPIKYKLIIFNKIKKSFKDPLTYPTALKFMLTCLHSA